MQLERKNLCPLFKSPCKQLDCAWFMKMEGTDPQNPEKYIEEWDCAMNWNVRASVQVSKEVQRGTGGIQAATESFRNEVVMRNGHALPNPIPPRLIEPD